MRNPPILISVIGFFAMLAGLYWLYLGLRLLGFDWFGALGDLPAFEQSGLWGWLALGAGIAWIAAAGGLFRGSPRWWLWLPVVAGLWVAAWLAHGLFQDAAGLALISGACVAGAGCCGDRTTVVSDGACAVQT